MVEALNSALDIAMKKHREVIILGEDVGIDGGVFRVTDKLIQKYGKDRVLDTPLAEAGIVGIAFGMALTGLKPVAEMQFSGFAYQGFAQIEQHIARIRNRSRGCFTCPVVIRAPYGGGIRALEHHSESRETYYMHTPGLKVVIPSNPYDAKGLLLAAIRDPDPVIFLEPKKIYRAFRDEVPDNDYEVPIGEAKVVRKGKDITIIAWGSMLHTTMKAVDKLENIDPEVIDLRTLAPLDDDTIIKSVKKTGRVLIVQEAPKTCGPAAEIIARINEKALLSLEAPVKRVSGYDIIFPLYKNENNYLPSITKITHAIHEVIKF